MSTKHVLVALAAFALLLAPLSGCNKNEPMTVSDQPADAQVPGPTIRGDSVEVELVEEMATARAAYRGYLEALVEFYARKGMYDKRKWAEKELKELNEVPQYVYLMIDDLPDPAVYRPVDTVPDANQLYRDALEYYKHLPLPLMYDKDKMRIALEKFRKIIREHPNSDKVDDSYFYAGEILKEYFNENLQAVEYYERAYTIDPKTPHPARFQRAVVLDFRLHQRDKALAAYRDVLQHEANRGTFWSKSNADFSASRIKQLTGEDR